MKFDAKDGDRGIVRDAAGVKIPYAVRGDTTTGEVWCEVRGPNGDPVIVDGAVKLVLCKFKAPLRVTRYRRVR